MKKLLYLSTLLVAFSARAYAQHPPLNSDTIYRASTEFGFGTAGFNNLFVSLKFGTAKGWFISLQSNELNYQKTRVDTQLNDTQMVNQSYGFRIGIEKRKWITPQVQFAVGLAYVWQHNSLKMGRDRVDLSHAQKQKFYAYYNEYQTYWGFQVPFTAAYNFANQRMQAWFTYAPSMYFTTFGNRDYSLSNDITREDRYKSTQVQLMDANNLRFGIAYRFWKQH